MAPSLTLAATVSNELNTRARPLEKQQLLVAQAQPLSYGEPEYVLVKPSRALEIGNVHSRVVQAGNHPRGIFNGLRERLSGRRSSGQR